MMDFDKEIEILKKKLKDKNIEVEYNFLGDSIIYKDKKYHRAISRHEYLILARKIKEYYDLKAAVELTNGL